MKQEQKTLSDALQSLENQIAALQKALEEKPEYGMGKGDPGVTQWELNQTLLNQLQERASSTRKALQRMEHGIYGTCQRCGAAINPERLAILPDTRLCIRCAQKAAGE
ncbi:MAG: TraR/DksA C4-type zinc finger protein [Anaerolineae bacterium]|nr:TraR/DksA C4-type zinc finger protein [Anaerolineae bacterium]